MKLLDMVTIKRPETCDSCPFGSDDADEGSLCCGYKRDYYATEYEKLGMRFHTVQSPKEAFEHDCECKFIEES